MKPIHCLALVYESGAVYIDSAITNAQDYVSAIPQGVQAKVERVQVKKLEKRSLSASALSHVWYRQLSGFMGFDENQVKQELKIKFGFSILRENEDVWPRLKMLFIGCQWHSLPHSHDDPKVLTKVKMAEIIPCTSLMEPAEMKRYMDTIKNWAISEFNLVLDNGNREN